MEFNIESILNNTDSFKVQLSKTKVRSELAETLIISDNNNLHIAIKYVYADGAIAFSCLMCLTHMAGDHAEHVEKCQRKYGDTKYCQVCFVANDESHAYSNSHSLQLAKMKLILQNECKIGITNRGEIVIDRKGPNIAAEQVVYRLLERIKAVKGPDAGGLAAYHLKAALLAAASNNSSSKKLAENSTVVQMLLQICMLTSNGHVPCPISAKITYALNGYSVIEMIGALKSIYPDDYVFNIVSKKCRLHNVDEKTVEFKDLPKTYDHLIGLLTILTGKVLPKFVPAVAEVTMKKAKSQSPQSP